MVIRIQASQFRGVNPGASNLDSGDLASKFRDALSDAQATASGPIAKARQENNGAISPLGSNLGAEGKLILVQATAGPLNLGEGFSARLDRFTTKGGEAGFEIHVYKNGEEVGIYGREGWFNKHGKATPSNVPESIQNRLKGVAVDELRKQGTLPPKGEGDIKGKPLSDILRFFGKNLLRGPIIILPPIMPGCAPDRDCGA